MSLNHILVPRTEADVARVIRWYAIRSPQSARKFVFEFDAIVSTIETNPLAFPPFDSRHRFAKIKRFPYLILFRLTPQFVWVVGVGRSSRSGRFWNSRTK